MTMNENVSAALLALSGPVATVDDKDDAINAILKLACSDEAVVAVVMTVVVLLMAMGLDASGNDPELALHAFGIAVRDALATLKSEGAV